MAWANNSEVAGWLGWPLTITGQPAAHADAESPPATANANGKLLAEKTATGPIGNSIRRMSTRGAGWRSGWAGSMIASTYDPSRSRAANLRNWPVVRARSPVSRAEPRAGFGVRRLDELVAERLDLDGSAIQEFRESRRREMPRLLEGGGGMAHRAFDLGFRRVHKMQVAGGARARVHAGKGSGTLAALLPGEILSCSEMNHRDNLNV